MTKRLISIIIAVCITVGMLSTFVFAAKSEIAQDFTFTVDCSMTAEEALLKAYSNLSDKAKIIYNSIGNSSRIDIYEYGFGESNTLATFAAMGAAEAINQGLNQMGLNNQVIQALNQLATAIIASLADGPLPIGDIYAISVGLYTAVVLATHWDEIVNSWDDIVALFQQSISQTSSTIGGSMDLIEEDTIKERELPDTLNVIVLTSSKTIRVDDTYYVCSIPVAKFGPREERFYPGMIFSGTFWVCSKYVPFKIARAIMAINADLTGILTKFSTLAFNLCSTLGTVRHHDPHKENDPNYLSHYHYVKLTAANESKTHAWYLIKN